MIVATLALLAASAALPARLPLDTATLARLPAARATLTAHGQSHVCSGVWLAELDSKLGNRSVLVAHACDGKALAAADGPLRLVVPGEARAARSVRQLQALRVVAIP